MALPLFLIYTDTRPALGFCVDLSKYVRRSRELGIALLKAAHVRHLQVKPCNRVDGFRRRLA